MILSYSQSALLVLFFRAYALSFPTMMNCVVVLSARERRMRWMFSHSFSMSRRWISTDRLRWKTADRSP